MLSEGDLVIYKATGSIHRIKSRVDIARSVSRIYGNVIGPMYRYWLDDSILICSEDELEVMFTI